MFSSCMYAGAALKFQQLYDRLRGYDLGGRLGPSVALRFRLDAAVVCRSLGVLRAREGS